MSYLISAGDFLQVRILDHIAPFTDPKTASEQFVKFRTAIDLQLDMGGASKCPTAIITTPDGLEVGYISYNARVWCGTRRDWENSELVYCPSWERDGYPEGAPVGRATSKAAA